MASSKTTNDSTWASPHTYAVGDALTASGMNTYHRDQQSALKTPAYGFCYIDEASNYTTSSTSFADMDSTNLSITITTGGGPVLLFFCGITINSGANSNFFEFTMDGVQIAGNDGILVLNAGTSGAKMTAAVHAMVAATAASHTFTVQWKTAGGTATVYAGAGTGGNDVHPFFSVRELA